MPIITGHVSFSDVTIASRYMLNKRVEVELMSRITSGTREVSRSYLPSRIEADSQSVY